MGPTENPKLRLRNSGILTAAAAGAIVLAGLGIAGAQTGGTDSGTGTTTAEQAAPTADAQTAKPPHPGMIDLAVAAKVIGITEDELRTALRSGQSIAQVAQSKNVDVQKVIDALVADATAKLPDRIKEAVNRVGGPGGPGGRCGHGGHHGPGGRGGPGGHLGPRPNLDAAAQALGMTNDELRTALQSGRSLADVAKSKNVDVQKVIDALVAEAKAKLADEVKAGRLTQAQADRISANLTQRITDRVNHTGPACGPGRMHDGPPPADDQAPAASPAATTA